MKNKKIQGSSLTETLVALSIITFAVMGILTQQLQSIQSFHNTIEEEMINSMLLNTIESHQLGRGLSEIQYNHKKFYIVHTANVLTIAAADSARGTVLVTPLYLKAPNADGF